MFRNIWLLGCAGAGIWGAVRGLEAIVAHNGGKLHLTPEVAPMLLPVGIVGALVGVFLGGILLPLRR
jgi:hypothetical protein